MKKVQSGSFRLSFYQVITNATVKVATILLTVCMVMQSASAALTDHFVTTWKTDNPGDSSSTSIIVPILGGPYDVDWDNDGVFDETGLSGTVTHDFGVAGTYTIRIRGTYDSIVCNSGGDHTKIVSLDQWGTNTWTSMNNAFNGAINLKIPATDVPDFSAVTNMSYMFFGAFTANPDTSGWDTTAVTDMSAMFSHATSANPDTGAWDTAAVTSMRGMFSTNSGAQPDTSGWDTSSVTDMAFMFYRATSANPDTSGWKTSAVTDISYMFDGAISANPDISNWDTSSVTDMTAVFRDATLANPDTGGWDTSSVKYMLFMFENAISFDRDIGTWDVSSLASASFMFSGVKLSTNNYDSLLVGWNAQELQPGVPFNGGASTYCSEAAIAARANMIASDSWVITDGGHDCPPETCNVNMVAATTEDSDESYEACEILILGPDLIVEDAANVSANSGLDIRIRSGFLVETGATLNANVCGQSLCETSASPMPYGCHSCVDQICDADPTCCSAEFDQTCLDMIDTICSLVCE